MTYAVLSNGERTRAHSLTLPVWIDVLYVMLGLVNDVNAKYAVSSSARPTSRSRCRAAAARFAHELAVERVDLHLARGVAQIVEHEAAADDVQALERGVLLRDDLLPRVALRRPGIDDQRW